MKNEGTDAAFRPVRLLRAHALNSIAAAVALGASASLAPTLAVADDVQPTSDRGGGRDDDRRVELDPWARTPVGATDDAPDLDVETAPGRWRRRGALDDDRDRAPRDEDDASSSRRGARRYFTEVPGVIGPLGVRGELAYGLLDAKVEKETRDGIGNEIRLARHLDVDRTAWIPRVGVFADLGRRFRLEADWATASFRGENRIPESALLGGDLFAAGDFVESRFRFHDVRLGGALRVVDLDLLEVAVPFGFRYLRTDIELRSAAGGRADETTETLMPFVGVTLDVRPVDFISLGASFRFGASAWHDGKDTAAFAELGVHAAFVWEDRVRVGAGYDYLTVDVEQDDDADEQVDFDLGAPMVFVEVRF